MAHPNSDALRHLTDNGVDARYYWPLGDEAHEKQANIRDNIDDPGLTDQLLTWYYQLDPHSAANVRKFEELTGVDLTELNFEAARVLLFFTITGELPGRIIGDPYNPHLETDSLIDQVSLHYRGIRTQLSLGLAKMQAMGDSELGVALINEIPELLGHLPN